MDYFASMEFKIGPVRQDGVLTLRCSPEAPTSAVELVTLTQKDRDWFGDISLTLEAEIAKKLAFALLRMVEHMEGK